MSRRIKNILSWGALALLIGIPGSDVLLRNSEVTDTAATAFPVDGTPSSQAALTASADVERDFNVPLPATAPSTPAAIAAPEMADVAAAEPAPADDAAASPFTVLKTYSPRQVGPEVQYAASDANDDQIAAGDAAKDDAEPNVASVASVTPASQLPYTGDPYDLRAPHGPTAPAVVADLGMEAPIGTASSASIPYPRPAYERPTVRTVATQSVAVSQPSGGQPDNAIFLQDWSEVDNAVVAETPDAPANEPYQAYVAPSRPTRAPWLFGGENQQFLDSLPASHDGMIRLDLAQQ